MVETFYATRQVKVLTRQRQATRRNRVLRGLGEGGIWGQDVWDQSNNHLFWRGNPWHLVLCRSRDKQRDCE